MKFNKAISGNGSLTKEGKEVMNKTLIKGLEDFFKEISEEEITHQQMMTIKSLALQVVSDNISYRKK